MSIFRSSAAQAHRRVATGAVRRIWGAAPQTAPDLTVPMDINCAEPLFQSPTATKVSATPLRSELSGSSALSDWLPARCR